MTVRAQNSKYRPAVKWHGGKNYLARRIIEFLPGHQTYVEPFAGGLSVLLNKRRTDVEIASDKNANLMAFYHVLRDRTDEFMASVTRLSYCQESFDWACQAHTNGDAVESAVVFLVRNRFSRGGLGKDFAWSDRKRGGQPGDVNGWQTIVADLPRIARRIAGVELRCQDAVEVIREFDGPNTLFYLDPPYVRGTRTARDIYRHEMSDEDHGQLLETILACRGKVVISGYSNQMYDRALAGWERRSIDMPNHSSQSKTKQRRVEVLWLNDQCQSFALW
jgi:DNA adenine methylase